jgi:hypothetical protein
MTRATKTAPESQENKGVRQVRRTTKKASGSDLLSHTVTNAVPSALEGLTSVFGMGTGVAPPPLPPESLYTLFTP